MHSHGKQHPRDLGPQPVEAFPSNVAADLAVAASTQNQALAVILFHYQQVLELPWRDGVTRARRRVRLPIVLTRQKTNALSWPYVAPSPRIHDPASSIKNGGGRSRRRRLPLRSYCSAQAPGVLLSEAITQPHAVHAGLAERRKLDTHWC